MARCLLRPMSRNSALEELSVRRFAVIQAKISYFVFWKVRLTEINVDLLLGLRLMSTAGFLHRKPEVSAPARTGMRIMAAHFTRATQLASAVLAIAQCLSVCFGHKSVFCRIGWTDRAGFWQGQGRRNRGSRVSGCSPKFWGGEQCSPGSLSV